MKELNTVDLFCGADGASTGLELALRRLKMAAAAMCEADFNEAS